MWHSAGNWIVGHDDIIHDKGKDCPRGWNMQEYIMTNIQDIDGKGSTAAMGVVVYTKKGKPTLEHFLQPMIVRIQPNGHWRFLHGDWTPIRKDVILEAAVQTQQRFRDFENRVVEYVHVDGIGDCVKEITGYPCSRVGLSCFMSSSIAGTDWNLPVVMFSNCSEIALRSLHPKVGSMKEACEASIMLMRYRSAAAYIKTSDLKSWIEYRLRRIEEYRATIKDHDDEETATCEEAADAMNELSDKYGIEIAI